LSARDGGFPGLAVFSLLALLVVLTAVALVGLKPWATDSLIPDMGLSPGLGAGLDDAVAVVPDRSAGVAAGRVAPPGPALGTVEVAARPAPVEGDSSSQALAAVAPARSVSQPTATPVAAPPAKQPVAPPPQPVAAAPEPVPAPASEPVVATVPPIVSGPGRGPGTAVGVVEPPPSCEGDEYTITVTLASESTVGEDAEVEILIQRFEEDGSVSELQLEGELGDVDDLAELLESEGNCVKVVLVPPLDGEGAPAPPEGTAAEPAELDEALEPATG
jgi:hypothetical protein